MVQLGDVLTQRQERVPTREGFGEFVPITVHLDGKISIRNRDKTFKGQMFAARRGDVVFSKIDARNGAIGVLPPSIPAAAVTSEFPVFTPRVEAVGIRYLELALRAGDFISMVRRRATGTSGRKRITSEMFQSLSIPLPTLAEQESLVTGNDRLLAEAATMEAEAARIEQSVNETFAKALGIVTPPPLPDRPAFVASFRDLGRWSHEAVLRNKIGAEPPPPKYPIVALGEVIADLQNGWSPKCFDRPAEAGEWGVLKLGAVSFGVFDERENKALPSGLKPRPALTVGAGQVLISRANITRLVGAIAFVDAIRPKLLLSDKIFRLVFRPNSAIDPRFTVEVLRTPLVREQIEANVTGTSPTMKNISKPALLALTFPLPPLKVQQTLVTALGKARKDVATLRKQAEEMRAAARAEFETALFG